MIRKILSFFGLCLKSEYENLETQKAKYNNRDPKTGRFVKIK